MPKEHSFITPEIALADQVYQASGRTAGVDRVEQDAFGAGKQANSLYFCRLEDAIARLAISIIDQYILCRDF